MDHLPLPKRQEAISFAYVRAIVAKAGMNIGLPGDNDVGEDFIIFPVVKNKKSGRLSKPLKPLYIQVKASYKYDIKDDNIIYDLDVKNYNQLIDDSYIPFILVLYCMPPTENEWLHVCNDYTALKYCGYWTWLKGDSPSENKETQRIVIPRDRLFTEHSLKEVVRRGQMEDYDLYSSA